MQGILKHILSILILLLFFFSSVAQQDDYVPKARAKNAFDKAMASWRILHYEDAEKELKKAIKIDPGYPEPYILLGDVYYDQERYTDAIHFYKSAIRVDSLHSPNLYYLLGRIYFDSGQYEAALKWIGMFLEINGIRDDLRSFAEEMQETTAFREYALKNPVPFQPENLGKYVNSKHNEYINSITLDESSLVYTLNKPDSLIEGFYREGFVMAEHSDTGWVDAGRTLPDLHKMGNIGAMSLSPDGRFLFFTSCGARGGFGSCDIWVCAKQGDGWSSPQNLGGAVNTSNWDSQPCFSADGKTLYFVSARKGTIGGADIWYSEFIQGSGWTKAANLGSTINTHEEEMAPFIHPDGKTLYFSSKGHPGMGGFDLFVSRKDSAGNWSEPENLGYPVNTESDEINIVVSTNGEAAYLSSRQEGGFGGYDIYRFDLPPERAPLKVGYIKGVVYDADTEKPLKAEILLIDLQSGEVTVRCESDPMSGRYLAALPGGKNYALNISKPGYLFYSENVNLSIENVPEKPVIKDVYLLPVKSGRTFVLKNIFFETDKYALSELSRVELLKLESFLIDNPYVRIMICGHTDDIGSVDYNQVLSENRAGAVYDFLINSGIDPDRLEYKGFGMSQPVSDNETEEGRALNRRTEILIL
ncbi:MAG: OmpA family protein [Bacteroidales bacterium]|jgi:outer membrane protein OmpA-like peptidoglycan-associated protein|nr:OmpA family protein [Bacteroidales bacterium]